MSLELPLEELCQRRVTDGEEESPAGDHPFFVRFEVLHAHPGDFVLSDVQDIGDRVAPKHLDLRIL